MQRQELYLKEARGDAALLADLAIPGKYRWVPEGMPPHVWALIGIRDYYHQRCTDAFLAKSRR